MTHNYLLNNFRLTTAEIVYRLPDYPDILQSYIWQDYDLPPNFPKLHDFLEFWSRSIEGQLHSVRIMSTSYFAMPNIKSAKYIGTLR